MKTLLGILTILVAFQAQANFHGTTYSDQEKNNTLRCEIQICRQGAPKYFEYCDWKRQTAFPGNDWPVYQWIGDNGYKCYCPCDYTFEHRVRTGGS